MDTDTAREDRGLEVRCSCGRTAVLRWNAARTRYECENPEWVFSGENDGERLWHCGRAGHFQNGVRDFP